MPYDDSRGYFRGEADFPGPRTMGAAARWLDDNAGRHERFMLFVDEFDPHEPFDTPEPYASMYDAEWEGAHLIWPPYVEGGIEKGVIDARQARQIRASYGGKLTMIDRWFGRVLDELDRNNLWDDTLVILCTDHGHYLGEHDTFGKPGSPIWKEMGGIPLMIRWPGGEPGRSAALTTTVDLHATLCDIFGVEPEHTTHGTSLVPLLDGSATSVRDHVLAGYWSRHVYLVDDEGTYGRSPVGDGFPLEMWSNRWSSMPI